MLSNNTRVTNGRGMVIKNLSVKKRGDTLQVSFDVAGAGQLTPNTVTYDLGYFNQIGEIKAEDLTPTLLWNGQGNWNESNIVLVEKSKKRYFVPYKFCQPPIAL